MQNNRYQLEPDVITMLVDVLRVQPGEITDILMLKKGMTNRSFLFTCKGKKYIIRIPGEGTDRLINREQEAKVYQAISGKGICDDPIYINIKSGYKITKYIENVRCCNPFCISDLKVCMRKLRKFHSMGLKVDHEFDIFRMIDFYELLRNGMPSIYEDYTTTKKHVLSLKSYIEENTEIKTLTHIDAVSDNFLFDQNAQGEEALQLIDWEYAGMQDPHVDIAMFCIYSMYDRRQIDRLISIYFEGDCPSRIKIKIYCYIAVCGLLWSNWCEYKRNLGVEFGEYALKQYRFARDYYKIAVNEMNEEDKK